MVHVYQVPAYALADGLFERPLRGCGRRFVYSEAVTFEAALVKVIKTPGRYWLDIIELPGDIRMPAEPAPPIRVPLVEDETGMAIYSDQLGAVRSTLRILIPQL